MDALFVPLAGAAGASVDQVKLITCLLIAYPLGDQPVLKHLFNIGITLLFFFPASVLATYYLTKYYHAARMPWVVFVIVMGHLTVNHVIRSIFQLSYETLEVTGPQMVLVMKLTTFAWNVHDGRRPAEDLDKWQTTKRVTEFPSLLEFLDIRRTSDSNPRAQILLPGILVGPYLDYVDYMDLVNETMFKKLAVKGKNGRNVPAGRKRVAYRKMIAVFQLCGVIERTKYYAIWTLTEGASILTGLGFTGLKFAPNFKVLLDAWNMKTNVWLRECIYKRVTPKGKKPGFRSSMITFTTRRSGCHGIAGGYYMAFMTGAFITTIGRLARGNIRPLVLPAPGAAPSIAKRAYDLVGTVITILLLNYCREPRGLRGLQAKQAKQTNATEPISTPVHEKQFMLPPSFDQLVPPPQK
ncbi:MBOAT, membrane-bound O-acyltransferase family-domain-containing protein [Mycena olivaceomarginata]|nr:MBOAT, membrane-bound O-acyltransferase family-domain-containing protein [Mycena olivaceomarginata]